MNFEKIFRNQKFRNVLSLLMTAVIVFNVSKAISTNKDNAVKTFNYWERYAALKKNYYDSIYANKKGKFIRDEYLYSFAAGSVIQGVSPILVNPETPPLGRYFISLSIILFQNEHLASIFFGIGSLILLFILGRQIFSSNLLAIFPLFFLSLEPLFINQFRITPLLDIIQLFFLLAFFIFFNKGLSSKKKWKYFLAANIMVGAFISTKFFGTGVTLAGASIAVLLLTKKLQQVKTYLATLLIAPLVLLTTYIPVLFKGYPPLQFFGIQKWVFLYNMGHVSNYFTFFPLFLFNKWYSWWDNSILSDSQWQITWPVLLFIFILTILAYWRYPKFRITSLNIVIAWTVLYLIMLQTGYMSARYFVILLPPMYLIAVYFGRLLVFKVIKSLKFVK